MGDDRLKTVLADKGYSHCPSCGREVDRGDVAWNEAGTEAGTPVSVIKIQCQACDEEVVYFFSWYPCIEVFEEAVDVIEDDLEPKGI